MSEFRQLLERLDACEDALAWIGERDLRTAWAECERGDWMLWLICERQHEMGIDDRALYRIACDCSEAALVNATPGDDRPRLAIEARRGWLVGTVTDEELKAACAAAESAESAAESAASAAAEPAARAAARAAAWAAAWDAERKWQIKRLQRYL